jgi:hypothetical protein
MSSHEKASQRVDAAFEKRILFTLLDAMEAEGFTRYRKQDVDWPIHDGFHCWVGLNTAVQPDRVKVIPLVGLHVVSIMRLYTTLEGRKYDRGVATYAVNMGELEAAADERAFAFAPQQSQEFITSEAKRLAKLYAGPGREFARSIASYEALLPRLRERVPMLGGYPERVASCLYLMGRKEEVRASVESFLAEEADYFRGFAVPFLKMLNEGGSTGS